MRKFHYTLAIFSLFLTACSSKPVSYLPTGSTPIVNIEADIAAKIKLDAASAKFNVTNLTELPLNIAYKLFWYDQNGVTQSFNPLSDGTPWLPLRLNGKQTQIVTLTRPTEASQNYRLYLKSNR